MDKQDEQYAAEKYNSQSLLEAYNNIGHENSFEVNKKTKDAENIEGALMYTYVQAMDSYREGTIDGKIVDSLNEESKIPQTTYDEDLQ